MLQELFHFIRCLSFTFVKTLEPWLSDQNYRIDIYSIVCFKYICLLLLEINSAGLKNWYFTLISPYHLWRAFVQCMNNFLRLSLINQINFSEFIISHTTQKRKIMSQCSKNHNLLPVIFYAELNNFSGLQSCNLLYLYVAQISCLTLAQRVLTACRDSTCRKMPCLDLFFYI